MRFIFSVTAVSANGETGMVRRVKQVHAVISTHTSFGENGLQAQGQEVEIDSQGTARSVNSGDVIIDSPSSNRLLSAVITEEGEITAPTVATCSVTTHHSKDCTGRYAIDTYSSSAASGREWTWNGGEKNGEYGKGWAMSATIQGDCAKVEFYDKDSNHEGYEEHFTVRDFAMECIDLPFELKKHLGGLKVYAKDPHAITALMTTASSTCPSGWSSISQDSPLNGDLNQGSGGKYIYLCSQTGGSSPISGLTISDNSGCPGMARVPSESGLNGDLNEGAGGKYIYLCQATGGPSWITNLKITQESTCSGGMSRVPADSSLNGDLNEGVAGKYIYLCYQSEV